jgi:hypothetical protein
VVLSAGSSGVTGIKVANAGDGREILPNARPDWPLDHVTAGQGMVESFMTGKRKRWQRSREPLVTIVINLFR